MSVAIGRRHRHEQRTRSSSGAGEAVEAVVVLALTLFGAGLLIHWSGVGRRLVVIAAIGALVAFMTIMAGFFAAQSRVQSRRLSADLIARQMKARRLRELHAQLDVLRSNDVGREVVSLFNETLAVQEAETQPAEPGGGWSRGEATIRLTDIFNTFNMALQGLYDVELAEAERAPEATPASFESSDRVAAAG
jgi:hypothetical protein